MKSSKLLAMGTMALAAASLASAATYVKITGSTAFRKATMAAIIDSLETINGHTVTGAYDVSTKGIGGSNRMIVHGFLKSTHDEVYYQTAWAGSVGGVQTLAQNLTTPPNTGWTSSTTWLADTNTMTTVSVDGSHNPSGGTDVSTTAVFESAASPADIAMSDTFQSSTPYTDPVFTDNIVGLVGFTWVKGKTDTSLVPQAAQDRLTNISPLAAQLLLTNGTVPLSLLTGNSADSAYDVVLTGRDNDSGTRSTTFAECGFGIFSDPLQYSVNTVTGILTQFPVTGGYASGGSIKTALQATIPTDSAHLSDAKSPNNLPYILVSYVGIGDTPGAAQQLTYNGVAYGTSVIQEGQYTFWSYEHMFYRDTFSGIGLQAANDVVAQIGAGDALASGILYNEGTTAGTLRVFRFVEGGPVISTIR